MARLRPSLLAMATMQLLSKGDGLWPLHTERQSFPGSAHHDTEVIFLRGPIEFTKDSYFSVNSQDFRDEIQVLPHMWNLALGIFAILQARDWGRVLIVRLKP